MSESLKTQITAIEKNVPWTYIYFVPQKSCKDVDAMFKEVLVFCLLYRMREKDGYS